MFLKNARNTARKEINNKQNLRITEMKLGMLVNFNENLIKEEIKRVVNNL